jgi:hypothetical protein
MAEKPASRLCGPIFATSDLEAQIIRLEGAGVGHPTDVPCRCCEFLLVSVSVAN